MYQRFAAYIRQHGLLQQDQKVLLAISGGMDSMAMLNLFQKSPWSFAIAHCNFQLRGTDSDDDQQFVRDAANGMGAPFFVNRFDTKTQALETGESVQMAARRLRYQWLEKVRLENGYDAIATAHHLDDAMETLLINIIRGSGISGMKSIPKKTGSIVRPLLFASRDDIQTYCKHAGIQFREDRTNLETKYARNRIRHTVLPGLKELNPSLTATMAQFFERMEATETIYAMMIDSQKQVCTKREDDQVLLDIAAINALPYPHVFLYEFIREFGFSGTMCRDMLSGNERQPGKLFYSGTHVALIDRGSIIVYPKARKQRPEVVQINPTDRKAVSGDQVFHLSAGSMAEQPRLPDGPHALMTDLETLSFPLLLRPWKAGDTLVPLGMKGKKKVSDLLTDKKMPLHKKKRVLVLTTSDNEIVWVAGVRADDRFKITSGTRNYFYASIGGT